MKSVSAEDHPDFPSVKWSRLELDWIRERDREWEEENAELRKAIGLATTIKGSMEIRSDDPVGMMQEVCEEVARLNEEIEFLQKERSGVIEQSNMHPSWLSKSKEEILDCLRFQGATTAVLLVETKELREEVARLMSSMHRENTKDTASAGLPG